MHSIRVGVPPAPGDCLKRDVVVTMLPPRHARGAASSARSGKTATPTEPIIKPGKAARRSAYARFAITLSGALRRVIVPLASPYAGRTGFDRHPLQPSLPGWRLILYARLEAALRAHPSPAGIRMGRSAPTFR